MRLVPLYVFDPERAPELNKGRGHDGRPLGVREKRPWEFFRREMVPQVRTTLGP
jgi:hypothetical protein